MTSPLEDLASLVGPRGVVPAERVAEWMDRGEADIETLMIRLLPVAAACARARVSQFSVGAVALGGDGRDTSPLYLGANLEFVGQAPAMTVHAEQSAIHNAWLHGETNIQALAVTAPPCGHCRQFLLELAGAASLEIVVPANDSSSNRPYTKYFLAELLPAAFGPEDLSNSERLMASGRAPLHSRLYDKTKEPLPQQALETAEQSYAPYTGNYAGVALQSAGGEVFVGRVAESAAYNPTLSPMAAALTQFALARRGTVWDITAAVLVERATLLSQRSVSEALLSTVARQVPLRYLDVSPDAQ